MALTVETLSFLRTPSGTALLNEAATVRQDKNSLLQALTWLRGRHDAAVAAAAIATVDLRERAAAKFPLAAEMFFTADGLEQATGHRVSTHCAARFRGLDHVLDLCCGIGGDTIALAREARVTAIDRDPLRVALARANVEVCGLAGRVHFIVGDVSADDLPRADAAFCDPGRRTESGRIFDVRRYQPPLAAVLRLAGQASMLAIKVAPGIRDEDVPPDCEAEFIQEAGTLKQAMLWLGPFATNPRRATLLPGGLTLTLKMGAAVAVTPPSRYLYEPQPAVIRAHLVQQLGRLLGATQLDETTAFLTGDVYRPGPFATIYTIDESLPFNLKALQRRLRALNVGAVVIKKRASPLDPQALEHMLRLAGDQRRTLVLTRVGGRHTVLICRSPLRDTAAGQAPVRVDSADGET